MKADSTRSALEAKAKQQTAEVVGYVTDGGQLGIVKAPPGSGKTGLLLNVIKAAAVGTGLSFNVAHISVNVDADGVSYGINYQLQDQKKYAAAQAEFKEAERLRKK